MSFKLTYSTMFNPPAEMHERFEAALSKGTGLWKTKAVAAENASSADLSSEP